MHKEIIQYIAIPLVKVLPQIRGRISREAVQGMAETLKSVGILSPIRVRRVSNYFVVIDGHIRLLAAQAAGFVEVPVIIEERELCDAEVILRQMIANCQRHNLNPMEKARAIHSLMQLASWSASEVALQLGFSNATVSRHLPLLELDSEIQSKVESGEISASAAYKLAHVADPTAQAELASEVAAGRLTRDGLTSKLKEKPRKTKREQGAAATRIIAPLGERRSITVSGPGLTLDTLIEWLEELLSQARKARPKGLELATFLRVLRDQTKLPAGGAHE